MEISGKVLREVEFRDRLRGYDTDEVDEFLEQVAVAVDELLAEHVALRQRAERAERELQETPALDDDGIRRTLVLAQRTADLALREARAEAEQVLGEARARAEAVLGEAEEEAARLREESDRDVRQRASQLSDQHERLTREIRILGALLESERTRITQSLTDALRFVGESMGVSDEVASAIGQRPDSLPPGELAGGEGPRGGRLAEATREGSGAEGASREQRGGGGSPIPPPPGNGSGRPDSPASGVVPPRPSASPPPPPPGARGGGPEEPREVDGALRGSAAAGNEPAPKDGAGGPTAVEDPARRATAGAEQPSPAAGRRGRNGANGSLHTARDIEAELLEDAGIAGGTQPLWNETPPRPTQSAPSRPRGEAPGSGGIGEPADEDASWSRWSRASGGLEPLSEPPPTQAYRLDSDGGWTA